MEFCICFTEASNRYGNVSSMDEQMTMYIEGLNPAHCTIVSQYPQDNPKVPFLHLVNYGKAPAAAIWVHNQKHKKATLQAPIKSLRTKTLHSN